MRLYYALNILSIVAMLVLYSIYFYAVIVSSWLLALGCLIMFISLWYSLTMRFKAKREGERYN